MKNLLRRRQSHSGDKLGTASGGGAGGRSRLSGPSITRRAVRPACPGAHLNATRVICGAPRSLTTYGDRPIVIEGLVPLAVCHGLVQWLRTDAKYDDR
ncbi:hypothetical protein EVAR_67773_1 [Eumeta japonica]|uniref:Uncharacterized protein n=1 Tax=Eumeta variegata TaxID=151549 RepID=A0A4C1ZJ49_EUMVA|nr:hypothetical protein EVAR_67773_1 [Eumeta japonica]